MGTRGKLTIHAVLPEERRVLEVDTVKVSLAEKRVLVRLRRVDAVEFAVDGTHLLGKGRERDEVRGHVKESHDVQSREARMERTLDGFERHLASRVEKKDVDGGREERKDHFDEANSELDRSGTSGFVAEEMGGRCAARVPAAITRPALLVDVEVVDVE